MAGPMIPAHRGKKRSYRPMSEINVTPFVDVMLVLLIIFMVAAPLLTVGVPVDLPQTRAAAMTQDEEPLVVTVDATGMLYLQESPLTLAQLVPRLEAISANNRDLRIYVRGDRSLAYGEVMAVLGRLNDAGFTRVALIAELPQE